MTTEQQQKRWYVARTRDKQELSVRHKIEALQVECYLPTRREVRQLKYRKKEVEVPLIRNMIFVHATKQAAIDLHNKYSLPIFYISDLSKPGMLVVPDKQMDDFIKVMDLAPDSVSFDAEELQVGQKVQVVKGELSGVEGDVATASHSTYVVIRIRGVFAASIKIPKSYLKIIP